MKRSVRFVAQLHGYRNGRNGCEGKVGVIILYWWVYYYSKSLGFSKEYLELHTCIARTREAELLNAHFTRRNKPREYLMKLEDEPRS